jgi:hypothetical protein
MMPDTFDLQFNDGLGWRISRKGIARDSVLEVARSHRIKHPNDDLRLVSNNPDHDKIVACWFRGKELMI